MLLNVLISLVFFLVVALSYLLIQFYRSQQELEIKTAISYFSSILYKHNNLDDLLWEVVKQSISRLKLEDCVVYILDPVKESLIQKQA